MTAPRWIPVAALLPGAATTKPQVTAPARPRGSTPSDTPQQAATRPATADTPTTRYHRCQVCTLYHRPKCAGVKALRWPIAPLLDLVPGRNHTALLQRAGVSGSTIAKAAEDGLTDRQADNWATTLGYHPSMVWHGWDQAALTPLDDIHINGNGWRPAWLADQHDSRSIAA